MELLANKLQMTPEQLIGWIVTIVVIAIICKLPDVHMKEEQDQMDKESKTTGNVVTKKNWRKE